MTDTDKLQDLDNYFTLDNSIALLLLKEGDKPSVLIMAASEEQKNKIEEICEDEGWYWRAYIENGRESEKFPGLVQQQPSEYVRIICD